jgi:hypothetical protein
MVSARGTIIGILVMTLGFVVLLTALSPEFLFSTGIITIGIYNIIQNQFKIWMLSASILIIIVGLTVMGKVE